MIGGSLTGLTTALFLAREGVDVQLFEAGAFDQPHGLGAIELNVVEHPHRTARALGERIEELWAFTDRNKAEARDLGVFDACSVTWHGTSPNEPEALVESAEALRRRRRVVVSKGDTMVLPEDGQLMEGARHKLIRACVEAGVELHEHHEVRLDEDQECVWIGGQRIQTEMAVLAAGWGCAGLDARLEHVLSPLRDTAVRRPGEPVRGFHRSGQGWMSWREEHGEKAISGARWATPHLEVGETEAIPDPRVVKRLGEGESRAWICCATSDQLPLVGPLPGQPRRLVATGFGTIPATWSFAAARALVDGILGDADPISDLVSTRRLLRWRFGS